VKRTRKRLALRLAASAVAGAVLTVAVAWGLHASVQPRAGVPVINLQQALAASGRGPRLWSHSEDDPGLQKWPIAVPSAWPEKGILWSRRLGFGRRLEFWHRWGGRQAWSVEHNLSGWPLLAVSRRSALHEAAPTALTDKEVFWRGWAPTPFGSTPASVIRPPLHPEWPGFAIDTAFYGGIVFLLWSAPGFLRRRSRLRRGACPACGYDLRGSSVGVCPECGA
jgi:hypothetical protein